MLTDFWYNHFNVFLDKGADRYLVTAYERDAIRPHVLGKFRDLLEATAQEPGDAVLPGQLAVGRARMRRQPRQRPSKRRRGLNENYGRELMELHTLGVDGGYTQKDVTEVARCFTGWTIRPAAARRRRSSSTPRMHDKGEKIVLGVTIPAGGGMDDGEKVLDIPGASSRHRALHLAEAGAALRRRRSARSAGRSHGEDVSEDRWRSSRSDADHARFEGILVARARIASKMKTPLEMVVSAVRAVERRCRFRVPAGQPDGAAGRAAVSQAGADRLFELQRGVDELGGAAGAHEFRAAAGAATRCRA